MIRVLIEVVLAWLAPFRPAFWSDQEKPEGEEEPIDQAIAELERTQVVLEARWQATLSRRAAAQVGRRR